MALPYRGDGSDRPPGSAVPPARMPLVRDGRPLKRWRYVGVYGERLMLCAGVVRIGVVPQVFWAVWDRQREALRERTRLVRTRGFVTLDGPRVVVRDGDVAVDLELTPGAGVETLSQHGPSWIWTRKEGAVRARGVVRVDGEEIEVDALGCVDESAGYHARTTAWKWSAGVGLLGDGRPVGWNLVTGVHDAPVGSERTVWVDGVPSELPPATFGDGLAGVAWPTGEALAFTAEATRSRTDDLKLFKSDYTQPFGTFSGTLPGGLELDHAYGVMEAHTALW